jgi:prepilin-type N-terminal cleavage/methylation domain-containing protein
MRRGFTLIELLVVIAIIAILAGILFAVFARAPGQGANAAPAAAGGGGIVLLVLLYLLWHFVLARAKVHQSGVTLEQFNKLETGMTVDEVNSMLGPGTLAARSGFAVFEVTGYTWQGNGDIGANMSVQFENGRLTTKAQAGLK